MNLKLYNIGKFKQAEVDLNGITVLAGENNTGKSTISKTLYCVFNSFSHNGEQIRNEKKNKVVSLFRDYRRENESVLFDTTPLGNKVLELIDNDKYTPDTLLDVFENTLELKISENEKEILTRKLNDVCSVNDKAIQAAILKRYFQAEFFNQIRNIFVDEVSEIQLKIKEKTVKISINSDNDIDYYGNFDLITEALYLDDPSILDDTFNFFFRRSTYNEHRETLKRKFLFSENNNDVLDEILANEKIESILSLINSACDGKLARNERSLFEYRLPKSDKAINIKNVSMGLKSFAILKSLLLNGDIKERATLILDEPEVHIHPKWQLIFAEIIVLLQKKFNLTILLNTHSPYFMEAIEVYSKKHEISEKCNYYLAKSVGEFAEINDVTDNVEEIYKKLAEPYQTLYNVRARND